MRTILSLAFIILMINCTSCTNKIEERDQRIASTLLDTIEAASKRLPIGKVDSIQIVSVDNLTTTEWAKHVIVLTQHEINSGRSIITATENRVRYSKDQLARATYTAEKQQLEKDLRKDEQFLAEQTTEMANNKSKLASFTTLANSAGTELTGYLVKAKLKIKVPGETTSSWSAPQKYLVDKDIKAVIGANGPNN